MRTKNAKRLWPVPATLAVVALAAFLAFGLMATTGAQPVAAQQDDPCVTVDQAGDATPTTGTCQVTSTEAIIKLTNNNRSTEKTFHIFGANVGSGEPEVFPPGTVYDATTDNRFEDGDAAEAEPIRYMSVEVPAAGPSGPASMTVTISGEPLGSEMVWVFTDDEFNYDDITGAPDDAPIKQDLPTGGRALTIQFLGPPVLTVPDTGDTPSDLAGDCAAGNYDNDANDADRKPDPRSSITVTTGVTDGRITGEEATVTVTIMDAHCRPLEGKITYSVEYMEGTALQSGRNDYTTQPADYVDADQLSDDKGTMHDVSGWATSGPVLVNVSATFTGGTGSLTLEPDALKRAGKLDDINVIATCYQPDVAEGEEQGTTAQAKICGTNTMDTETTDDDVKRRPRTVFMVGQAFTVRADAVDVLDTTTGTRLSVEYPDIQTDKGVDALSGATSFTSSATSDDTLDVMIHEEAPPGRYMLTVKARQGSGSSRIDKEATVEIIVSARCTSTRSSARRILP